MNFYVSGRTASVRTVLLAGAAALTLPSVAAAQDMAAAQEAQEAVDSDADAIPDAEDSATGNVIIVTATKREQTLQETPVAVSVTTAETIERAQIRDIADLATVVPSLRVSQNQSAFATSYSVRGFGTDGNNIGLEPSVAMFVDGVYRSRAVSQISDLPDIQRVEVLRGPQSTLFGKNASAGVISIVTKEPSFDLGGTVEASYGNYNAIVAKAYLTGGLTDSIAASVSGGYNKRDGFITNEYNGDDLNNRNRWFARGQLMFDNGGRFKARIIGDYDQIDEECCGVINVRPSAATGAVMAVGGMVNDYRDPFADVVYSDVVPTNKVKNYGVSGQLDYELTDSLSLTSITAYREMHLRADQDVDFTSARLATGANLGKVDIDTFTQELRLASNFDGPINFLLGGYYFDETARTQDQIVYGADFRNYVDLLIRGLTGNTQNAATIEGTLTALTGTNYINQFWQPGQGFFNTMTQDNTAYSFFGNVDIEPMDGLVLTLGANYTKDKKDVVTDSFSTDVFSGVDLVGAGRTAIFATGLSQQIGNIFFGGTPASQAQIQAIATNPATAPIYAQVAAGVGAYADANASNPSVNPLLGLQALQFLPPFQNCPNAVEDCKTRDSDWSWTARLAYEVSPSLNVYASWATGFKASSFNLSRDSRPTAADAAALRAAGLAVTNLSSGSRFAAPENSEVFEVGVKGNWDMASANLTFFRQSIKDFQTNTFTGTGFLLGNAGKQSTFGIEFDGMFRASRELTLSLALTYLDPKYDSYIASPFGDVSGTGLVNIPKISSVMGFQWDKEMDSGDHFIVRADYSYQAPIQLQPGLLGFIDTVNGVRDYTRSEAVARQYRREVNDVNASITYAFDMGLEVSVWGRNLLDDRYITTIFDSVAQDESISGYLNMPRTYGVSARYRF